MEVVSALACLFAILYSLTKDAPCVRNQEVSHEASASFAQAEQKVISEGYVREP